MVTKRIWIYGGILFILASAILTTQVVWIFHSARIEENFLNQRVNMALCSAMDALATDRGICSSFGSCTSHGAGTFEMTLNKNDKVKIDSVIREHLLYYNISVPFQTTFSHYQTPQNENRLLQNNQALLFRTANAGMQNVLVEIQIPSKNDLIRAQINGTFILSIVLLLLIVGLFVQAIRSLNNERNIRIETVEFINTMAHNLKTPISNISFALSLFKKENPELKPSSDQYISIIDTETVKLKQRARQILGAASVDAVLEEAKKTKVNVHELIEDSIDSFSLKLKEIKAQISVQFAADRHTVVSSPIQLSSAVQNIIDNAISYTNDCPQVQIKTENEANSVKIEIEDNGPGIPIQDQVLVFKKGFRVDGTRRRTEGFGLGLYLAKILIEKQGGTLSLFSDGVSGSRFTIQLPTV